MSKYIINLLSLDIWNTIFVTCFFLGLFFILFVILGAVSKDTDSHDSVDDSSLDSDVDTDLHGDFDTDISADTDISTDIDHDIGGDFNDFDSDLDSGIDTDVSTDFDHDIPGDIDHDISHGDIGGDVDTDMETDFDLDGNIDSDIDHDFTHATNFQGESHIEVEQGELGFDNESYIEESRYLMGNIAVFLLVWGQIGWISNNLTDFTLVLAFLIGYLSSKAFAWILANYAKTVINPIRHISKGDVGVVIYGITPYKPGMVHVARKDGVISTIIARGAFPHDIFEKNEKGYIWSKEGENYTLTKGVIGQPDLKSKKKAKSY